MAGNSPAVPPEAVVLHHGAKTRPTEKVPPKGTGVGTPAEALVVSANETPAGFAAGKSWVILSATPAEFHDHLVEVFLS